MNDKSLQKREAVDTQIEKIDAIVRDMSIPQLEAKGITGMTRHIMLARAMLELKKAISGPVLEALVALADSPLGFMTDKAKEPPEKRYPPEVLRDALIEGMLRGAQPVGNEINVIAAKCYLTKAYFQRLVLELVEDLVIQEGVPEPASGGYALVPMRATWIYQARAYSLVCEKKGDHDTRIMVRVNAGMGVDAVLGKAMRKLLARIYRQCTGAGDWIDQATEEHPTQAIQGNQRAIDAAEPPGSAKSSESPADAGEDGSGEQIARLEEKLSQLETITDVRRVVAEWEAAGHVRDKKAIHDAAARRIQEIRDSRGERSNRNCPSMVD